MFDEVEKLIFLQSIIIRLPITEGTADYEYGILFLKIMKS